MKKIYTLLTLLAFFGLSMNSANAQTKANWYEPDTVYRAYASDPDLNTRRDIFTYNPKGSILTHLYQEWNTTTKIFVTIEETTNTYDVNTNLLLKELVRVFDGALLEFNRQTTYAYSGKNEISRLIEMYNVGSSSWVPSMKTTKEYDGDKLTKDMTQNYTGGSWENHSRTDNTYDGDNLVVSTYFFGVGTAWKNYSRYIYTYEGKNPITILCQLRDAADTKWDDYIKYICTYDAQNNEKTSITQYLIGGVLTNYSKDSSNYDAKNNLSNKFYYIWDGGASKWKPTSRKTLTYNQNNDILTDIWADWDGTIYTDVEVTTYTYDGNFNIKSLTHKYMGSFDYQHLYEYDGNNNRTEYKEQYHDGTAWIDGIKIVYEYDANNNGNFVSCFVWDPSLATPDWVPTEMWGDQYVYYNNMQSGGYDGVNLPFYIAAHKVTAHYIKTHEVHGIPTNILASQILVYPNPTSDVLRVTGDGLQVLSVEIYDMMGKKQKSRKAEEQKGEMLLDVSHLANGIYFLNITTENGVVTKKIVKQ